MFFIDCDSLIYMEYMYFRGRTNRVVYLKLKFKSSVSFYPSQPEILKWLIWREVMHVDLTHCHCGTDIIY